MMSSTSTICILRVQPTQVPLYNDRRFCSRLRVNPIILTTTGMLVALLVIAGLGAVGGLVNCAIAQEFALPHIDREAKVWRPGWIGNVVVGAVAAPVIWGMYGPLAGHAINAADKLDLTLAQVFVSVVIGLGGGGILTVEAQKQAERVAK